MSNDKKKKQTKKRKKIQQNMQTTRHTLNMRNMSAENLLFFFTTAIDKTINPIKLKIVKLCTTINIWFILC